MRKYLWILLILFLSDCVAQDYNFQRISSFTYSDGISQGALHKFQHVFQNNPLELKFFKRYNRTRKTQNIVNASLFGFVGFVAVYDSSIDHTCSSFDCQGVLTAIAGVMSGVLLVLVNAVFIPVKISKTKKLLNHYFDRVENKNLDTLGYNEIRIGPHLSGNGIGLSVYF